MESIVKNFLIYLQNRFKAYQRERKSGLKRDVIDLFSNIRGKIIYLAFGFYFIISYLISHISGGILKGNDFLNALSSKVITYARGVDLGEVCKRMKNPPFLPDIWPGEHYKLLAGFVLALKPKLVIEIGTGTGLSALSIKKYLPNGSKLITFDIIPWDKKRLTLNKNVFDTILMSSDFDESIVQYIDDLSNFSTALKYKEFLKNADIIFIDGPKDGVTEYKLMKNFEKMQLKSNSILIFDDIHFWNILPFWRKLAYPKLDLTPVGHWSGTGIVQWIRKDI